MEQIIQQIQNKLDIKLENPYKTKKFVVLVITFFACILHDKRIRDNINYMFDFFNLTLVELAV